MARFKVIFEVDAPNISQDNLTTDKYLMIVNDIMDAIYFRYSYQEQMNEENKFLDNIKVTVVDVKDDNKNKFVILH